MKALEKDRRHRYGAPSELAADIQRFLRNEPVMARPAGVSYRARKYFIRHRLGVSIATCFVVLLVGFAILEGVQIQRITRERDRAGSITKFITDMFIVPRANVRGTNEIPISELLDNGEKGINEFKNDPELQAQMMQVMGTVYNNLNVSSSAEQFFAKALEIQHRVLGPENPVTLKSSRGLALALFKENHTTEAEKVLRKTLDTQRRVLGPQNPDTLESMRDLAYILWRANRLPEAKQLIRKALMTRRETLGNEAPQTLDSMQLLFLVLADEKRYSEAEQLMRERLEMARRVFGPEDSRTFSSITLLIMILEQERKYHDAEELAREAVYLEPKVPGMDKLSHFSPKSALLNVLSKEGNYAEAEKAGQELLEAARKNFGSTHPQVGIALYNLACIAALARQPDRAFSLLRESVNNGFSDIHLLENDPDLASLRGNEKM